MKVAGRSNVPRWGQQSNAGNLVSPENQASKAPDPEQLAQQVNAPSLGSEEVTEQPPPITVQLREPERDFEWDIREIDSTLHNSPRNLEIPNKEGECHTAPINLQESRGSEKSQEIGSQGGEVDKAIEELRHRVVLQDILGTKVTDGNSFATWPKSTGKENSHDPSLYNVDLNKMHEVKVHGESRGAWRRVPWSIDDITVAGGFTKLSGAK